MADDAFLRNLFNLPAAEAPKSPEPSEPVSPSTVPAEMAPPTAADVPAEMIPPTAAPVFEPPKDLSFLDDATNVIDEGVEFARSVPGKVTQGIYTLGAGGLDQFGQAFEGVKTLSQAGLRKLDEALGENDVVFGSKGLLGEYVHQGVGFLGDEIAASGSLLRRSAETARKEDPGLGDQILEGLGGITAQAAVLFGTGGIGGTSMFTFQGAKQVEEKLQEAGLEGSDGDMAILLGAPATAVVERLGLEKLVKVMPPQAKTKILQQLKSALAAGGIEALEERVEDTLQDLAIKLSADSQYELSGLAPELTDEDIVAGGTGATFKLLLNTLLPKRYQLPPQQLKNEGKQSAKQEAEGDQLSVPPLIQTELEKAKEARVEAEKRVREVVQQTDRTVLAEELPGVPRQEAIQPVKPIRTFADPAVQDFLKEHQVRTDEGVYVSTNDFLKSAGYQKGRTYLGVNASPSLYAKEIEKIDQIVKAQGMRPETQQQFLKLKGQYETAQKNYTQWKNEAAQVIEGWQKLFLPDTTIILDDNNAESATSRGNHLGLENGVSIISLNPYMLNNSLRRIKNSRGPQLDKDMLYAALSHEFGHAIITHEFQKAPVKVQATIRAEYAKWVKERAEANVGGREYFGRFLTPPQQQVVQGIAAKIKPGINETNLENYAYLNSFAEYLAQEHAKFSGQNAQVRGVAAPFWKKVTEKLKRFYQKTRRYSTASASYSAWAESLIAKNAELELQRKYLSDSVSRIATRDAEDARREPMTPEEFSPDKMEAFQLDQAQDAIDSYQQIHGGLGERPGLRELMRRAEVPVDNPRAIDRLDGARDNFSKFKGWTLTLLQIAKRNPHIEGFTRPTAEGNPGYLQLNRLYQNDQNRRARELDTRVGEWWGLGTQGAARVGQLLAELDRRSFRGQTLVDDATVRSLAREYGVTEREFEVYQDIRDSLRDSLDYVREALISRAQRLTRNPQALQEEIQEINRSMDAMMQRNYFPSTRFGNHAVVVRAIADDTEYEGRTYNRGETLLREHFETKGEAEERSTNLKRLMGNNASVGLDYVEDTTAQSFQGMPPAILNLLRESLPADQQQNLERAILQTAPGRGYLRHQMQKRGVAGASQDFIRAYTSYMHSLSSYLGHIDHQDRMTSALDAVEGSIQEILLNGGDARKRRQILNHLRNHQEYLFNPGGEMESWSALAFNWYLAGVPKQAVLNLMQLPTVIGPYLGAKYGDVTATKNLLYAETVLFGRKFSPDRMLPELQEAIRQGEEDGVLDQSFAYEVAALKTARNLDRMLPGRFLNSRGLAKLNQGIAEVGGWLFHKSEMHIRHLAFIAAWKSEMDQSGDRVRAYQAGRDAVQAGAFEYMRYNRPRMMRGKVRPLTIFMTHVQHMLEFLLSNNPGRYRALAALFVLAGVQGLPFVEDAEDILDWLIQKYNKMTGDYSSVPDTKTKLRKEIYSLIEAVGVDSPAMVTDFVLHGASKHSMGIPFLTEQMGIPFPDVDLSGSLTLGNIIPGTEALTAGSFTEALGKATEGALGAGFGIPLDMLKAISDTTADLDKRFQSALPKVVANPLKALDYADRGYVNKQGIKKLDFDENNPYHQAEIIAQALGFTPTRITNESAKSWAQLKTKIYYDTQKRLLQRQFMLAVEARDDAVRKDVLKDIRRYNDTVPYPSFKINPTGLERSVMQSVKNRVLISRGLPTTLKDIPVYVDIERYFEDIEKEIQVEEVP